jgi:hypothetical protein
MTMIACSSPVPSCAQQRTNLSRPRHQPTPIRRPRRLRRRLRQQQQQQQRRQRHPRTSRPFALSVPSLCCTCCERSLSLRRRTHSLRVKLPTLCALCVVLLSYRCRLACHRRLFVLTPGPFCSSSSLVRQLSTICPLRRVSLLTCFVRLFPMCARRSRLTLCWSHSCACLRRLRRCPTPTRNCAFATSSTCT